MSKISVAIADDNQRMVTAIKQLLETDDEIQVVGSENNGESTLEMIKDKEPDVVLLDIIMP
ncbi:MAG: response regulator, partial [Anaerostipes sp.]|nr:response regulator [Anaerostipes sp.]